MTLLSEN
jgi:hypothetical protein